MASPASRQPRFRPVCESQLDFRSCCFPPSPSCPRGDFLNLTEVAIAVSDASQPRGIEDAGHGKRVRIHGDGGRQGRRALRRRPRPPFPLRPPPRQWRRLEPGLPEAHWGFRLAGIGGALPGRTTSSSSDSAVFAPRHRSFFTITTAGLGRPRPDRAGDRPSRHAVFLAHRPMPLPRFGQGDILMARAPCANGIARRSKSHFSPELVGAFLEASTSEAFWLSLEPRHVERYIEETVQAARPRGPRPASPAPRRHLRANRRR